MKYPIDQIALFVDDVDKKIEELEKVFGESPWVVDTVHSHIIIYDRYGKEKVVCENVVNLRFNYELMKTGIEFELISMAEGFSYHQHISQPCISHFGAHVDDFIEARNYFNALGYRNVQYARTMDHTGTNRRYQYIFVDTRPLLGYYLKLINRIEE